MPAPPLANQPLRICPYYSSAIDAIDSWKAGPSELSDQAHILCTVRCGRSLAKRVKNLSGTAPNSRTTPFLRPSSLFVFVIVFGKIC